MRLLPRLWLVFLVFGCSVWAQSTAPTGDAQANPLAEEVEKLQDTFLLNVEKTTEPERVFDDYEAQMRALINQHPGRQEPFVGLMELFEKCDATRTRRLLDENLARADLPEKVRKAYNQTGKTLALLGSPVGLAFTALDGSPVRFEEFRGKVVVIDFWATWCGPCVRDLPKLRAIYAKHQAAGLVVVGVSFDRERAKLDAFLKTNDLPWRQTFPDAAEKDNLAKNLGVTGGYLPMVFIIGRDGKLRHTLNSRFRTEEKIAALLRE